MDADAGTSDGASYAKIGQQRKKRAVARRFSLSHSSQNHRAGQSSTSLPKLENVRESTMS